MNKQSEAQKYPTIYNKDRDKTVRQLISIFEECHAIVSRDEDWKVDKNRKEATERFVSTAKKILAQERREAAEWCMNKLTDYTDFTTIDTPVAERRKLDVGDIYMNVAKCLDCGWIIRSKNRHNMAACKCGKSFIDGGSWYIRTGGNVELHTVYYKYLPVEEQDEHGTN